MHVSLGWLHGIPTHAAESWFFAVWFLQAAAAFAAAEEETMKLREICSAVCAALVIGTGGCGGYSAPAPPPPGAQAGQISLTITDAPPAGVTVISFEVSITGATLNPGNVDLLGGKGPIRIEVKKLETESAFLSTASVPAANYTSLNLTFANPELTFLNNTGAPLAGCANDSVCEIKPTGTLTTMLTGGAYTTTFYVTSGMQAGLLVDLNLSALLSGTLGVDFSNAAAVSVVAQTAQGGNELDEIDDADGIVKTPASNQFTLQTTDLGTITVTTNSSTEFRDFDSCAAANFSCLADGQSVEVDLALMGAGSFVAKKIELEDDVAEAGDDELDGVIFKVDSATQFEIVVVDELRDVANVSVGDQVIVMLQTGSGGPSFRVDSNGLDVPSALQQAFEGATDTTPLISGQTVQVRKVSMTGGPSPAVITVTTDRVRLRDTRLTASIAGTVNGNNFNVGSLPGIFTTSGVNTVQVQTSSQTDFENVAGVSGLAGGNTVSLRGLLFASTPNPILIADKVRKR
jgi:hypothetical protein